MSIGLEDLNKRRMKSKPETKGEDQSTKKPTGAPHPRSRTARPWSSTGLHRATRNRPRLSHADAAMSEEWISLHAAPLFYVDLKKNSLLLKLNDQLTKVEDQIKSSIVDPLRALQNFCCGK